MSVHTRHESIMTMQSSERRARAEDQRLGPCARGVVPASHQGQHGARDSHPLDGARGSALLVSQNSGLARSTVSYMGV